MSNDRRLKTRREVSQMLLAGAGAAACAPQLLAQEQSGKVHRNISSFETHDWRPFFTDLSNGAILSDTKSRALHFWSEDETVYKLYPTSVPLSPGTDPARAHQGDQEGGGAGVAADAVNDREKSRVAALCPARTRQSARDACAVSLVDLLPNPRHP